MADSAELTSLKAKLASRERIPAYKSNCEELRKRIAELEEAKG